MGSGLAQTQHNVYILHNDANTAYGNTESTALGTRTLSSWPSGSSGWKKTLQGGDRQSPSSCTLGNHGLGIALGTFCHSFHSQCTPPYFFGAIQNHDHNLLFTSFSLGRTAPTPLPLPTLVHLLSLLFQVNQSPLISTLRPHSSTSFSVPIFFLLFTVKSSKPMLAGSFLHQPREHLSLWTPLKSSFLVTFDHVLFLS